MATAASLAEAPPSYGASSSSAVAPPQPPLQPLPPPEDEPTDDEEGDTYMYDRLVDGPLEPATDEPIVQEMDPDAGNSSVYSEYANDIESLSDGNASSCLPDPASVRFNWARHNPGRITA